MAKNEIDEINSVEVRGRVTRRSFLSQMGAAGVAATTAPLAARAAQSVEPAAKPDGSVEKIENAIPITLTVNGTSHRIEVTCARRCWMGCARRSR
jgi:xanthine dehydrogenase YagT iron-sulfur-binding subunit